MVKRATAREVALAELYSLNRVYRSAEKEAGALDPTIISRRIVSATMRSRPASRANSASLLLNG